MRKLGADLETFVREDATQAPPKGNVPVNNNAGRALSCKFSGGGDEHVRTAAKTVGEKLNIGVIPGRDRRRPKVVHPYRNSRSRREGSQDDRPMNRQSRCLPRLALQAMAQPPAGAYVYSYPPM